MGWLGSRAKLEFNCCEGRGWIAELKTNAAMYKTGLEVLMVLFSIGTYGEQGKRFVAGGKAN
jgi:hypothetical protein